jgi:hypothetical protein
MLVFSLTSYVAQVYHLMLNLKFATCPGGLVWLQRLCGMGLVAEAMWDGFGCGGYVGWVEVR